MRTLFTIDTGDYDPNGTVLSRPSARGIIIRNDKVAMIHSLKYDYYKFPGGGIEPGETAVQAMIREVREESGLTVLPETVREYGRVHRVSKGRDVDMFVQDNDYFLCDAADATYPQHLDGYEQDYSFVLEFVTAAWAIRTNREADHGDFPYGTMTERDARVLEMLVAEQRLP